MFSRREGAELSTRSQLAFVLHPIFLYRLCTMASVNLGVGALIALGGIIGYVKKQSLPSLYARSSSAEFEFERALHRATHFLAHPPLSSVAGVSSGALYVLSAYLITNGHALRGHQFAAVLSVVLSGVMAKRLVQ